MSLAKSTSGLAAGAIVVNAFIWGVSWWPLKALQDNGLHPLWATAAVYMLVSVGMLIFYRQSGRALLANPHLWFLAVASGMTNVGFNWAVTLGDVVRVVLLFYMMPAWSVLAAWVLLGEKPTGGSLLRLTLSMAGVLIVLKTPDSPWPMPQSGVDWLALMGGLSFAITNVLLVKFRASPSSARMLAMFGGGALLSSCFAIVGSLLGLLPQPALQISGIPVFFGLCLAFVIGNATLQYGAARLPASTTTLLMLTEILFASVSAAALGAADFNPRVLWGGSLIVLAALLAALAHHNE
jgi:drug/metabolite transporter (DMT)-like permease